MTEALEDIGEVSVRNETALVDDWSGGQFTSVGDSSRQLYEISGDCQREKQYVGDYAGLIEFSDGEKISEFTEDAMRFAVAEGLITREEKGEGKKILNPPKCDPCDV